MVFRPGGVAAYNVFTTWPALMAAFAATEGNVQIVIDDRLAPANVTAGTWALESRAILVGGYYGPSPGYQPATLNIPDNAYLQDLSGLQGPIFLQNSNTISSPLTFTSADASNFAMSSGAYLTDVAGAKPFITLSANQALQFYLSQNCGNGTLHNPIVDMTSAGNIVGAFWFSYSYFTNISAGVGWIAGVAGSTAVVLYDNSLGSDFIPSISAFGGTASFTALSRALATWYDDTVVPPLLGSSNVQGAIDALKSLSPGTPNIIRWVTHPVQTISAPTNQLAPLGSYHQFVCSGNQTLTSTPTINWPGAVAGQVVILHNVGALGTGHLTLNAGVGTALSLSNANTRIDEGGTMMLVYNGTLWTEVTHTQATST